MSKASEPEKIHSKANEANMHTGKILKTTVGELVEALTEEASALVSGREEAYGLAALALAHLLSNARSRAMSALSESD
jgi:hypothetical protein